MISRDLIARDLISRDLIARDLIARDLIARDLILISRDLIARDLIARDLIARDLIARDLIAQVNRNKIAPVVMACRAKVEIATYELRRPAGPKCEKTYFRAHAIYLSGRDARVHPPLQVCIRGTDGAGILPTAGGGVPRGSRR